MFWKEATKDYADVFCDSVHFYFVTWRTYSSMLVLSFVCVLIPNACKLTFSNN